ncbi:shikimate kinase AroL [Desulfonatronospira sp.]|uniref:shikimate kinase AroL n=1 Tax=Desulfonatronospira sp. TaxID=1962951 RepID=UPI0025BFFA65|nr:shikimate kinase AroL [Desulfonatronospira sp.]
MSGSRNKKGNIYLIGPRAGGKTSLAGELARRTGLNPVDTDELLQQEQGRSIQEIVADHGWEHFRELEKKVLLRTAQSGSLVVATGGGMVLASENRELLKDPVHMTVYLQADAELICARLARDPRPGQRPALSEMDFQEEVRSTLNERQPLYRECADVVLDAGKPLELMAEEVAGLYPGDEPGS